MAQTPSPPIPPPPPYVIFRQQILFDFKDTDIPYHGYHMIFSSDSFLPKVRILDPRLVEILGKHFPHYLPMSDYCSPEDYHTPEVIVCAFKTYRLHNVNTVNTVPNFANILERLEKECMEGAKKMMNVFSSVDFEVCVFPDNGRGCLFWNCYLASLLHTDAGVLMADEGLMTSNRNPCEGRLVSLSNCSWEGIVFGFAIKSRRGVVSIKLQWRDLLDLSGVGIIFRDPISVNLSVMDKTTLYDIVGKSAAIGRKDNEKGVMKKKCGIDEEERRATLMDRISPFSEIEREDN